jgi:hypothetical protein
MGHVSATVELFIVIILNTEHIVGNEFSSSLQRRGKSQRFYNITTITTYSGFLLKGSLI